MKSRMQRLVWTGVAISWAGNGGCFFLGGECYRATLRLSSVDHLAVEQDTGGPAPQLSVEAVHETGRTGTCDIALDVVSGSELALPRAVCDFGTFEKDEADPGSFTLFFRLGWDTGGSLVADPDFPVVEVSGDTAEIELWNGWIVNLGWDDPEYVCR